MHALLSCNQRNSTSQPFDRLNQVLQWSLGSIEILFSRHCPIWYGCKLRLLERMAYINASIYPFTSIPLVTYCTLPAICLTTGEFILPHVSYNNHVGFSSQSNCISYYPTCYKKYKNFSILADQSYGKPLSVASLPFYICLWDS